MKNKRSGFTKDEMQSIRDRKWLHDSHKWEEFSEGYDKCEYCGLITSNLIQTGSSVLCIQNPLVSQYISPTNQPTHSTNQSDELVGFLDFYFKSHNITLLNALNLYAQFLSTNKTNVKNNKSKNT